MSESFGARLRQQRERRQIPLTAVADATKISVSRLEALERDDVSDWPTGIFRRSFLRAYSQFIGLEPESVVREFLELYPDPDVGMAPAAPGTDRESVNRRPPTRLRYLVGSAIGSLGRVRPQDVQKGAPVRDAAADVGSSPPGNTPCQESPTTSQWEPDLSAVAHICTELSRAPETCELGRLLEHAANILDAAGLIVWVWDAQASALRPALAHGYSSDVLAKLPTVRRDAQNATAASFRSAETRVVKGGDLAHGALVVPLMTPTGCGGVLTAELRHGGEQREPVRALATIFAAQLAAFVGPVPVAKAVNI